MQAGVARILLCFLQRVGFQGEVRPASCGYADIGGERQGSAHLNMVIGDF